MSNEDPKTYVAGHDRRKRRMFQETDEKYIEALDMMRRGASSHDVAKKLDMSQTAVAMIYRVAKLVHQDDKAKAIARAIAGLPSEHILP